MSGTRGWYEQTVERARADVERFRSDARTVARVPLGCFSDAGVRSLLLRRLLLSLPLPLTLFRVLSALPESRARSRAGAFATEVLYWLQAKKLLTRDEWASLTHGPVILMYHAIGASGERASRHVLPVKRFRRQIAWLRARNYRVTSLHELTRGRTEGTLPRPHSVVLSFDDGYRDNSAALRDSNVRATIFIVTGAMGGGNGWDRGGDLAGRALLDWDEVRELARNGSEIGAHTRTHPSLTDVPKELLDQEVRGSLDDLQRELGPGPYAFAYPHGRFDTRVQEAVAAAGFAVACCSRGGVNDPYVPLRELRRVEIKGSDSFVSFVLAVWLGRRITLLQFVRSLLFG